MSTALSILDLVPVASGQSARDSFKASIALAQAAERTGHRRVWYAEHHNMPSIASTATSVLIGHIAEHTSTIRLGSGGVMLPNHSPLVIAEQFGTLGTLFPDRIDLGLGRAPGTDQRTFRALRRDPTAADSFPQDVQELQGYLTGNSVVPGVQAVPRPESAVPLYILGSSLFGARLAAQLGLPYAFASHFAPAALHQASAAYRDAFKPSAQLAEPYFIAGVNVCAADDNAEANRHKTAADRSRARALLTRGGVAPDLTDEQIDSLLASPDGRQITSMSQYTAVGTPAEVGAYLEDFAAASHADEVMCAHQTPGLTARIRSVELTAEAMSATAHQ